jgi:hypothetical protein
MCVPDICIAYLCLIPSLSDIVTLIFLEGDAKFDPTMIKSQFLHVFILVREETIDGQIAWR